MKVNKNLSGSPTYEYIKRSRKIVNAIKVKSNV